MLSRISIRNHQKEEISELDDIFLKSIINRKPQMSRSFLKVAISLMVLEYPQRQNRTTGKACKISL
jgi:hypothetical protein